MASEKKKRKRIRAVQELLSTEKTYVHLMGKLVDHYAHKLQSNTSVISSNDYRIVFPSDVHAILGLNKTFLEDLTKVIESNDFNNETSKIGDIIFAFCPHFKMYQNYLNNYSAAATRLAELRKKSSSSFCKYCDQQRQMPYFNNLQLESLIILPIQRMPRYKMLLEEIIKHTESNHPDLKQLKSALAKISEVNTSINDRMKEFESRIKVQNIENRFNGKVTNLVTPSRRYIKEGQLCKIKNQDDEDYLFILFSDCILYASQSMIGDKLVFGNLIQFNSKFKVKKTSDAINVHSIENLFELHSTVESFMVYSSTKKEMSDWMHLISKTFKEYMKLTSTINNSDSNSDKIFPSVLRIPDDFAEKCMVKGCSTQFSFINRRHHCKYCGFVICSKCSEKKLLSRPTSINSTPTMVRVCDPCYKENSKLIQRKSSKTVVPVLCHKESGKALELLGYDMVETNKKPKTKAEELEDELFKLYNIREEEMESEEQEQNGVVHPPAPRRNAPPPPPKKRPSAIVNFVKLDIEPKLLRFGEETKRLKEEIVSLNENNESLKQKVSDFETKLDKQKDVNEQQVNKLRKQNDALLDDNKRLQELVDSLSSTTTKLNEQKYAQEQNVNKLKKQNDELSEDNKRLQTLVDSLSSTTNEINKSEKIKDAKIEELKVHNDNLENELKQKEEEIKTLLRKQSEKQKKHDKDYQNLQKESNQKQQTIDELNENMRSVEGIYSRLIKEHKVLQTESNEKQQKIDQLNEKIRVMSLMANNTKVSTPTPKPPPSISPSIKAQTNDKDDEKTEETPSVSVKKQSVPKPVIPPKKHQNAVEKVKPQQIVSSSPKQKVYVSVQKEIISKPLIVETTEKDGNKSKKEEEQSVITPGTAQLNIAVKALRANFQHMNGNKAANDDDQKEKSERICMTCKMPIRGRALKTKGGLHHRKCHVCSVCKLSLAGKRYGILKELNQFGTKKKLCEQCTNKRNEEISKQQNNANRTHKKTIGGSNLREQMRMFQNGGMKKKSNKQSTKDDILKPSIASKNRKNKSNSNLVEAVNGSKIKRKKNTRAQTMTAQRKCAKCKNVIFGKNFIEGANGLVYHPNCFRCNDCDKELQANKWRSYAINSNKKNNVNLCTACAQKRDMELFSKHRGNLKLNI